MTHPLELSAQSEILPTDEALQCVLITSILVLWVKRHNLGCKWVLKQKTETLLLNLPAAVERARVLTCEFYNFPKESCKFEVQMFWKNVERKTSLVWFRQKLSFNQEFTTFWMFNLNYSCPECWFFSWFWNVYSVWISAAAPVQLLRCCQADLYITTISAPNVNRTMPGYRSYSIKTEFIFFYRYFDPNRTPSHLQRPSFPNICSLNLRRTILQHLQHHFSDSVLQI